VNVYIIFSADLAFAQLGRRSWDKFSRTNTVGVLTWIAGIPPGKDG
jgi:hypothetical protein